MQITCLLLASALALGEATPQKDARKRPPETEFVMVQIRGKLNFRQDKNEVKASYVVIDAIATTVRSLSLRRNEPEPDWRKRYAPPPPLVWITIPAPNMQPGELTKPDFLSDGVWGQPVGTNWKLGVRDSEILERARRLNGQTVVVTGRLLVVPQLGFDRSNDFFVEVKSIEPGTEKPEPRK